MAVNSIQLDEQLSQDMSTTMDECSGYVEENYPADSFESSLGKSKKGQTTEKCKTNALAPNVY